MQQKLNSHQSNIKVTKITLEAKVVVGIPEEEIVRFVNDGLVFNTIPYMRKLELKRRSSSKDSALVQSLREIAFLYLNYAQAGISGHRVAAVVFALRRDRSINKKRFRSRDQTNDTFKVFGGCNLEISVSTVLHTEAITLYKALSEGYAQVQAVGVTSDHEDQLKPLCGACRQLYMYVNPMTTIYVFGKDRKVKLKTKLIDTMKHPYISKGKII